MTNSSLTSSVRPYGVTVSAGRLPTCTSALYTPVTSRMPTAIAASLENRGTRIRATDARSAAGAWRSTSHNGASPPIHSEVPSRCSQSRTAAAGPLPTAWELTVIPASMAAAAMGATIGNSGTAASGIFGTITAAITLTSPYTDATRTSAARGTDPTSATGP